MPSPNSDNDGATMSQATLFAEYSQAFECIETLSTRADDASADNNRNDALTQLRTIWDKYLECPTLLDPYLERMVSTLAREARQCFCDNDNTHPVLQKQRYLLSALYAISKVRGRKQIQRFLPHQVGDVEPVLRTLQQHNNEQQRQEEEEPPAWESLYVLWIWLEKLSLVPFSVSVLDGSSNMISSLVTMAKEHLEHAGPTRETAASCLAAWLSRPDLQSQLQDFMLYSKDVLMSSTHSNDSSCFLKMGVMQCVVAICKTCSNRSLVLELTKAHLWDVLLQQDPPRNVHLRKLHTKWFARMACAHLPPRIASWRYQRGRRSLVENLATTSCTTAQTPQEEGLENDSASDENDDSFLNVIDPVEDAMNMLMTSLTDVATVIRWSAAKGIGRVTERLPSACADDVLDALLQKFDDVQKDGAWHGACLALAELARRGLLLPNRLQDVVPVVVKAIQYDVRRGHSSVGAHVRDAACYAYWAFARAYAPEVLKPLVSQLSKSIIVACLFDREINCRRAASAAFQECVGRQGADNFKHGISILTAADYYTLGNRTDAYTSVAYHVAQLDEYREPIIHHLYSVKIYHWDVAIRELASKALAGLAPLDTDLFVYTVVPYLLPRCTNTNLFVRHGAVLALAEIVLALGTTESNCCEEGSLLPGSTQLAITEVVPKIEKARLYRGRGGEIMRSAVCRLMECTCLARLPLTVKQQVRFLDSIDGCLIHPSEAIQESASRALSALMLFYFPVGEKGPSDRLQKRVIDKYIDIVSTNDNPAATRGFALALGCLPSKLLAPSSVVLASVLDCLRESARFDAKVGGVGDAETRRNSVVALSRICETVGVGAPKRDSSVGSVGLSRDQVSSVFESFFLALQDYNMDRRGDVGSWSRTAAMGGLETLTRLAANVATLASSSSMSCENTPQKANAIVDSQNPSKTGVALIDQGVYTRVISSLLKQLSEKLDSVRSHAGRCLERLLTDGNVHAPFIRHRPLLLESLDFLNERHTNWANASITFPLVMKVADIDDFFPDIISGMIISVGGLTESVTRHASAALLQWARQAKIEGKPCRVVKLGDVLLDVFKQNRRNGRVILPLLKTLDLLYSHGCLDELVRNQKSSFTKLLFASLKAEARNCNDVHRLLAITSLAIGLLSSGRQQVVQQEIFPFVFVMLGHRFPRVRRFTADHLYMRLLEDSDVCSSGNIDAVLELLLNTPWDADIDIAELRETRNKASSMLGVELPVTTKQIMDKAPSKTVKDEYESYASLVKEAAR